MKLRAFFVAALALLAAGCAPAGDGIDRRVEELLSRMTLQEKIGQMNQSGGADLEQMVRNGEVGSLIMGANSQRVNELQRIAMEESRLGIPILIGRDVIHGYRTIFPVPLGQAATFNPGLVEQGARLSAREAWADGIRWTFSPMVDIARDPRWGRVAEGAGEDPYLASQMGVAMVRGYQGEELGEKGALAACMKHFAGYGAAEGGRDYDATPIPERLLRNVYLAPFKACVDAGVATVMTSFNEIDGVPSTGSRFLLEDILRKEWGFGGMVVSDWNSVGEMVTHGYAEDLKDASRRAVNAGLDMDMASQGFLKHMEELVAEGKVTEREIDRAVRNILRLKFQLGLFENPYADAENAINEMYLPETLAAAKQCATESAILLKNEDGVLPLEGVRTIMVCGPMADAQHDQRGTWSFDGGTSRVVTPLTALRERYNVIYEPGLTFSRDKSKARFAAVRAAAARAEAVVFFAGEEAILSGEAHSLSDLNLKGAQSEMIAELYKTGKPVVVVVMAGRPMTVERDMKNCHAMLYAFHPGTMGGEALCDLISGAASPSGRLPMTMVREVGQIPYYYNRNNSGRPNQGNEVLIDDIPLRAGQTSLGCTSYYLDSGYGPLFPFGYGLSYTTFSYGNIAIDKESYKHDDVIRVTAEIANTGKREGTEVVQLYVRDLVGSIARPIRELKRFERVTLKAGESRKVEFELPVAELAFWDIDMEYKVEPGDFHLWVAPDADSGEALTFKVE